MSLPRCGCSQSALVLALAAGQTLAAQRAAEALWGLLWRHAPARIHVGSGPACLHVDACCYRDTARVEMKARLRLVACGRLLVQHVCQRSVKGRAAGWLLDGACWFG